MLICRCLLRPTRSIALFLMFILILSTLPCRMATAGGSRSKETGSSVATPKSNYKIQIEFPLNKTRHGLDGSLRLLEDARITDETRSAPDYFLAQLRNQNDDAGDPEKLSRWKLLLDHPPEPAVLRIVDRRGREVHSHVLDLPFAGLKKNRLYGSDKETFLVMVDFGTGMGTDNGPVTNPVEIVDTGFQWLATVDKATGERKQLLLKQSSKAAWKLVSTLGGGGRDFLQVSCSLPLEKEGDNQREFVTSFTRFHFNGTDWMKLERRDPGYWESGGGFPAEDRFPAYPTTPLPVKPYQDLLGYFTAEESWVSGTGLDTSAGVDIIQVDVFEKGSDIYIDFKITRDPLGRSIGGPFKAVMKKKGTLEFTVTRDRWGNRARGIFSRKRGEYLLDLKVTARRGRGNEVAELYREWVVKKRSPKARDDRHSWSLGRKR